MRSSTWSGASPRSAGIVLAAAVIGYAWWATGVPPFTVRAYVAVGAPTILLLVIGVLDSVIGAGGMAPSAPQQEPLHLRRSLPWVFLLLLAVGLEGAGLALGGHSGAVPTLSTVIDHALAGHAVRFMLFCGWLGAGWAPFLRAIRTAPPDQGRVA